MIIVGSRTSHNTILQTLNMKSAALDSRNDLLALLAEDIFEFCRLYDETNPKTHTHQSYNLAGR